MADDFINGGNRAGTHGTAADRLNSWKEIAAYLGKGVRTVQRWETHLGLPVRRLGREGGEIVYALKSEIDAWILNAGHARERDVVLEAELPPAPEALAPPPPASAPPAPPPLPPPLAEPAVASRAVRPLRAVPILLGVLALATVFIQRPNPRSPASTGNPVGAAYEAGVLTAWDREGKPLFKAPLGVLSDHRLDTRIGIDPGRDQQRIAVEDLEGDGSNEVLMIATSPSGSGDSLRVFNADGSERFTHVSGRPVTFGSEVYRGFNAYSMYFLRDPDGSLGLWITSAHVAWFPSVLERLSPSGDLLSEYWSNGVIRTIRPATIKGRNYLLVGAYNNEHRGASLAYLDRAHASGSAPAQKADYRCRDCAAGAPAEFVVFPGSDLLREVTAGEGSAAVIDARLAGDEDLIVTVHQTSARVDGESEVVEGSLNYTLSPENLRLKRMVALWGYLRLHRVLEGSGRLKHPYGVSEEKQLKGILRWSLGRFVRPGETAGDPHLAGRPGAVGSAPSSASIAKEPQS